MARNYKKLVCHTLGSDFRNVTKIISTELPRAEQLAADQCLIRNYYVGINASDVNYCAGRYTKVDPPFDVGFESVGVVAAAGANTNLKVGQPVALMQYGAFSEFQVAKAKSVIKLPICSPKMLPVLVSGLTASVALEQVGEMRSGETVLVTAAAGATGLFAVQLAKKAGNTVIGTCSSDEKVEELRKLGCDRAINYKKEDLRTVLRKEFPNGVDIVYESVGGEMFDTCVNALAVRGRLIVIGFISGYKDQQGWTTASSASASSSSSSSAAATTPLPVKLLAKSCSVRGFFLNNFANFWGPHAEKLGKQVATGEIESVVDSTVFKGLESVSDAIDYMYAGKNIGKVIVDISPEKSSL